MRRAMLEFFATFLLTVHFIEGYSIIESTYGNDNHVPFYSWIISRLHLHHPYKLFSPSTSRIINYTVVVGYGKYPLDIELGKRFHRSKALLYLKKATNLNYLVATWYSRIYRHYQHGISNRGILSELLYLKSKCSKFKKFIFYNILLVFRHPPVVFTKKPIIRKIYEVRCETIS